VILSPLTTMSNYIILVLGISILKNDWGQQQWIKNWNIDISCYALQTDKLAFKHALWGVSYIYLLFNSKRKIRKFVHLNMQHASTKTDQANILKISARHCCKHLACFIKSSKAKSKLTTATMRRQPCHLHYCDSFVSLVFSINGTSAWCQVWQVWRIPFW